jgi:hypothetical protein
MSRFHCVPSAQHRWRAGREGRTAKLTVKRRFVAENDWFVGRLKTDAKTEGGDTMLRCGKRVVRRPPKNGRPELTFDNAAFWTLAYGAFAAA